MTSRDFCLWLQGFFEMSRPDTLNRDQVTMLQQHLNLVFKHEIDPSAGGPEHQAKLNEVHAVKPLNPNHWPDMPGSIRC